MISGVQRKRTKAIAKGGDMQLHPEKNTVAVNVSTGQEVQRAPV
ncbi:unnamed protein product [marine sediment metagenome]|uniref:Uncharacterized protein n=1 Tax=marine sediment metagenome TaxID=412755 RepID=X1D8F9_9ZZZZ